jgi:hypothetical protein
MMPRNHFRGSAINQPVADPENEAAQVLVA